MKTSTRLFLLGLCASSFLCLQSARADDNAPPPGGPPGSHELRLPPGFGKLNLTDAQKSTILQIIKDTEAERREKIDQVLTPDQKAQLEQEQAEHHAHGGGPNGGPPPAQ